MKNINKSNAMELVGKEIVNVKNNVIGVVVRELDGKYTVDVNGEEKAYSLSTIIRNWKINEDETEEASNEEIVAEEIEDEDEIVEETEEEIMNENNEVVEEETEEEIINESNEMIEEETEEEVINENDEVIEEETEKEIINESDEVIEDETEEFVLETENRGIIDNIKETEGRVKITGHLYGVPVKFDKINQTTVWKTLNRLYDNRKDENDKYSLEDKKYLVQLLQKLDTEVFNGAFRCLVSKTKQNYIEELMK